MKSRMLFSGKVEQLYQSKVAISYDSGYKVATNQKTVKNLTGADGKPIFLPKSQIHTHRVCHFSRHVYFLYCDPKALNLSQFPVKSCYF